MIIVLRHCALTKLLTDELNALSEQLYGYSIFGYWFFHGAEDAAAVIESHVSFITVVPTGFVRLHHAAIHADTPPPHEARLVRLTRLPSGSELRKGVSSIL